jgi:uncharacterized protein
MFETLEDIKTQNFQMALGEQGRVVIESGDIEQSLRMLLTTPLGSIPGDPEYGCALYEFIDLPMSVAMPSLVRAVSDAVTTYEPRVKIGKIDFSRENGSLTVSMNYNRVGSNEQSNFNFVVSEVKQTVAPPSQVFPDIRNVSLISPANRTRQVDFNSDVNFQIERSGNLNVFRLEISTSPDFVADKFYENQGETLSRTYKPASGWQEGKRYFWRVVAFFSSSPNNLFYSDTFYFETLLRAPEFIAPTPLENALVRLTRNRVRWTINPVVLRINYRYRAVGAAEFAGQEDVFRNEVALPDLLRDSFYEFEVQFETDDVTSSWSRRLFKTLDIDVDVENVYHRIETLSFLNNEETVQIPDFHTLLIANLIGDLKASGLYDKLALLMLTSHNKSASLTNLVNDSGVNNGVSNGAFSRTMGVVVDDFSKSFFTNFKNLVDTEGFGSNERVSFGFYTSTQEYNAFISYLLPTYYWNDIAYGRVLQYFSNSGWVVLNNNGDGFHHLQLNGGDIGVIYEQAVNYTSHFRYAAHPNFNTSEQLILTNIFGSGRQSGYHGVWAFKSALTYSQISIFRTLIQQHITAVKTL